MSIIISEKVAKDAKQRGMPNSDGGFVIFPLKKRYEKRIAIRIPLALPTVKKESDIAILFLNKKDTRTSLHFSQINNKEAHISDKMLLSKHLVKDRGAPYEYRVYSRSIGVSRI